MIIALRRVRCRCIFVDEAQRLDTIATNRRKDDRKLGPVGELLKSIYDSGGVAIILAGTPSLEALVNSDAQYQTRWPASVRIEPFKLSGEFQGVVNELANLLPLPEKSSFSGPGVAAAIWTSCGGNFRRLKGFLSCALALAIDQTASCIELKHLQEAYRLTGDFSVANPFDALVK